MKQLLILVLALMLFSACIKVVDRPADTTIKADVPPSPTKDSVNEVITKPGLEEGTEPDVTLQKTEAQKLSPALAALKQRADSKVKSYSFIYVAPPDYLARDTWFIKGNKIRVNLFDVEYFQRENYYDTIFIDAEKKAAAGYCMSEDESRCPVKNKQLILDYNEVMIKTPYQIIKLMPYGEVAGSEVLWDRMFQVVKYKKEGITYKVWADSYSGLVAKQALYNEDGDEIEKYEFRHIQINNIDDAYVTPSKFLG